MGPQHGNHAALKRDCARNSKAFFEWRLHKLDAIVDMNLRLQDPNMAIVQHPEHKDLYAIDTCAKGFDKEVLILMLGIVGENVSTDGFRCAEVGAGTGGFTRQVSHLSPRRVSGLTSATC